jgi:hypothetical protein
MKIDLSRKYFLDATKERNVLLFAVGKKDG